MMAQMIGMDGLFVSIATVKSPVSGHLWDQALLSAYGRCPLMRG